MERKELTFSQRELIRMKREKLQAMNDDFLATLNRVALEHGIEEKEFNNWDINESEGYIIKKESNKP